MATDSRLSDTTLRSRERLRLTKQFRAIHRRGSWARGRFVSVGAMANGLDVTRIGLRAQRGTKGAVRRNRLKRTTREAYRTLKAHLKPGFDLVVVVKNLGDPTVHQLASDLELACRRLGLLH